MIVSIGTGFMPVTPIDPLSLKYTKLFSMSRWFFFVIDKLDDIDNEFLFIIFS